MSNFTPVDLTAVKRKRRPAGTPDPDAEVVSLSAETLLESDRYVCEICNQGFQREQNLQMHRRRHKVPWQLLKRQETAATRKRVFVCPEPSCLHHDRRHALGDLVGIKKHFRRKHSDRRQWVCEKCAKGYAVQSDYKAHLKTCGTRGHSCDCGRVFSRVESFIEHQDACAMRRLQSESYLPAPPQAAACISRTASSPSPSTDTDLTLPLLWAAETDFPATKTKLRPPPNLELQLSIGSSSEIINGDRRINNPPLSELRIAMAEKSYAEEARREARRQIEVAERQLSDAKRIRRCAEVELGKAREMKEEAAKEMSSVMLQFTCHSCKGNLENAQYYYCFKSSNICTTTQER